MHNLDAKDILTPQHVVKIEEYDKHMLIVLNSSYYDTNMEINSEHISILITGNVVIRFTESNNTCIRKAYKAIESDMLNIRRKNSGLTPGIPFKYDHCQFSGIGLQSGGNA